jgi:Protein of unknown function (DUF3617)
MRKLHGVVVTLLIATGFADSASAAAEGLAIKTGLWRKEITMQSNGKPAAAPMSVDVCYSPELLSFEHLKTLLQDQSCRWTRQDLTPTRMDVAFTCATMRAESLTEVDDPEHVRVSSTTVMQNGSAENPITSSESWVFLHGDCEGH